MPGRILEPDARRYFVMRRSVDAVSAVAGPSRATGPSADRADLEHLAVIAGFEGYAELAATIVFGHHRRHADDGFASGVVERRFHAWLLAELDQVARGRERQLEASALAA